MLDESSLSALTSKPATHKETKMSVLEAFNNLDVSSARDTSDHEAIFEISYQYLSGAAGFNHSVSFKNCIVALIKMDKYYKAVDLISKTNAEVTKQFPLEVAYVYYKVGDLENVRAVYNSASNGDSDDTLSRALKHVLAQTLYQTGLVAEALKLYHELIATHKIDSELDLACNERAIIFQLSLQKNVFKEPHSNLPESKQSYDYLFNDALIELSRGNSTESLELLDQALETCNKQNSDWPEEDLVLETAPIKLTIAYIYQTTGKAREALEVLNSFDATAISDLLVNAVLKTNYYSALPPQDNLNLSQRSLNYKNLLHNLRLKLTRSQWQILVKNHLLLSYQTNTLSRSSNYIKNSFAKEFNEEFTGDFSPLVYKVLLRLNISAEELNSEETNKAVAKKLSKFVHAELQSNEVSNLVVAGALLLTHVNSKFGNFDQSISILERIVEIELKSSQEVRLHAGVLGLLILLYELRNPSKLDALYNELIKKLESILKDQLQNDGILYDLYRAVALKLLNVNQKEQAYNIFELLGAANPNDAVVASILNGTTDKLTPVEQLESNTEVSDLLELNVDTLIVKPETRSRKPHGFKKPEDKVVKKRKPRLPTTKSVKPEGEFDPEKDLDKERWLPMKLRSYYKPSKKDKKKAGGHQGALESSPAPQGESKKQKKKKKGKK